MYDQDTLPPLVLHSHPPQVGRPTLDTSNTGEHHRRGTRAVTGTHTQGPGGMVTPISRPTEVQVRPLPPPRGSRAQVRPPPPPRGSRVQVRPLPPPRGSRLQTRVSLEGTVVRRPGRLVAVEARGVPTEVPRGRGDAFLDPPWSSGCRLPSPGPPTYTHLHTPYSPQAPEHPEVPLRTSVGTTLEGPNAE